MLGTGYGRVKAKARPILDDLRRSLQATRWIEPIPGVEWKGKKAQPVIMSVHPWLAGVRQPIAARFQLEWQAEERG